MAWRAFLAGPVTKPDHSLTLEATLFYYDDADPANVVSGGSNPVGPAVILHSKRFSWPYAMTLAQIRGSIEDEGQRARAAKVKADALTTQFPNGTTVPIPAD